MLLKIFRSNNLLAPLMLAALAIAFDIIGAHALTYSSISFSPLVSFFPEWRKYIPGTLSEILYSILVIAVAVVLNTVAVRKTLFTSSNYLVGLSFTILAFSLPMEKGINEMSLFSIPYLAFFLATLRQPTEKNQLEHFLDLGILLGVAAFFYFPAIILVLSLPAIASLQKSREPRIWIAAFIGFLAVWLIVFAISLILGVDVLESMRSWFEIFSQKSLQTTFSNQKLVALIIAFSVSVFAVYELAVFLKLKRVNNRRHFKMILTHSGIAVVLIALQWRFDHQAFLLLSIPLSFLWANFIYYLPKGLWRRIFLEVVLVSLIILSFLF